MPKNRELAAATLGRRLAALQAGTAKHIAGEATAVLAGAGQALPEALAVPGGGESFSEAVKLAQAALVAASADQRALLPAMTRFASGYTAALRALLGADNPKLRDFGIRPTGGRPELRNLAMLPMGTRSARGPRSRPRGQPRSQSTLAPLLRNGEGALGFLGLCPGGARGSSWREAIKILVMVVGAAALTWRQLPLVTAAISPAVTAGRKAPCSTQQKGET